MVFKGNGEDNVTIIVTTQIRRHNVNLDGVESTTNREVMCGGVIRDHSSTYMLGYSTHIGSCFITLA
ncbi:hypothetical protein CR513_58549, partial [Mucuna pruriens]